MRRGAHLAQDSGFTLLELVIVLAIMALMVGIVVSRGPRRSQGLQTRAAAGAIAQTLRQARATAIARSAIVDVAIDPPRHRIAPDGGAAQKIAADTQITVEPGAIAGPGPVRIIRFAPDGSASGGTIELGQGSRRLRITTEWLTGQVKVEDAK